MGGDCSEMHYVDCFEHYIHVENDSRPNNSLEEAREHTAFTSGAVEVLSDLEWKEPCCPVNAQNKCCHSRECAFWNEPALKCDGKHCPKEPPKEEQANILRYEIFEAIGQASMSWKPIPTGEFDSHLASEIAESLVRLTDNAIFKALTSNPSNSMGKEPAKEWHYSFIEQFTSDGEQLKGNVQQLLRFVDIRIEQALARSNDDQARAKAWKGGYEAGGEQALGAIEHHQTYLDGVRKAYEAGKAARDSELREKFIEQAKVGTNLIDIEEGRVEALYLRTILQILTPKDTTDPGAGSSIDKPL